jgi:hypothetical protein
MEAEALVALGMESSPTSWMIMASWEDAPHLTEKQKQELLASIPPHQRKARSRGLPVMGSGVIYPVDEDDLTEDDFELPEYWPKAFALDVGWKCTAAVWAAWDRSSDIVYIYSIYKAGHAEPAIHASALKARGKWIPGVVDPAARGRSQVDGKKLIDEYRNQELVLSPADNAVDAGIFKVYERMTTGRLKVFRSCLQWFDEFRIYRRNEEGRIVKEHDHLMDCTRYLILSGMKRAVTEPAFEDVDGRTKQRRCEITGY